MIETANSSQEEGKVTSQRPDDRLSALPESLVYWGLLVVAAYSLLRSVVYAAIKPFWFDEVLTYVVSRQGTPSAIWAALKQGVDGNPPTFYLLEHFAASLMPNEHIGYRLLSIVGFACALLLLFVFLKTRYGSHRALLCSSLLLITPLFTLYAEEARPYSLVAALIALAMVCYQRAPDDRLVLALRPYGPPGIRDFASFKPAYPKFLLYSSGSRFEWLPARLVHDGYRLERISWDSGGGTYVVQAPQPREPSTAYSLPTSAAPPRNPTVKSAP